MARRGTTNILEEFQEVALKLEALGDEAPEVLQVGVRRVAGEILRDINQSRKGHGVPVELGTLRSTGRVEDEEGGAIRIVYGGRRAPYALIQHERTDFHHDSGEARYLVRGMERWSIADSVMPAEMRVEFEQLIRSIEQGVTG